MAKRPRREESRVAGVVRSTRRRVVQQDRHSLDQESQSDTAALVCAGNTLQAGSTLSTQLLEALQRERDLLQQQLDATRELLQYERQAAQDRERRAADREALLLQLLHDVQQQNQRLLEAPRPVQPALPATPEVVRELLRRRPYAELPEVERPAPVPLQNPNRHARRQRILEALAAYPDGLHWREIGRLIGDTGDLNDTLQGMLRYKLVRRVGRGVYALPVIG